MAWIENLNTIEDFQITLSRALPGSTYFRGPVFAYPSTGEQLACWSDGKIRRVNDNSTLHTFSDLTYIDLGGFFVSEGIVYVSGRNTGTNYGYFKKLVLSTLTESTLYSRASTGEETACSLTYPGWGVFGFAGAAFLTIRKIDLSDDSITELFGADTIDKGEFYGYLASNNVSGRGITYSEYLVKTENLLQIHEGGFGKINLENQYYVLMGIKSKVSKEKWIGGGAAAGVVFLGVLSVVSAPVSVGIISSILYAGAGAATGNFFAAIVEGESGNQYISPTVIEVNSEEFKDLNCKSIVTLA